MPLWYKSHICTKFISNLCIKFACMLYCNAILQHFMHYKGHVDLGTNGWIAGYIYNNASLMQQYESSLSQCHHEHVLSIYFGALFIWEIFLWDGVSIYTECHIRSKRIKRKMQFKRCAVKIFWVVIWLWLRHFLREFRANWLLLISQSINKIYEMIYMSEHK